MLSNNETIQTFSEKYFCLIPMAFSEPWRNNAAKQADARPPAGHAIPALPGRPRGCRHHAKRARSAVCTAGPPQR